MYPDVSEISSNEGAIPPHAAGTSRPRRRTLRLSVLLFSLVVAVLLPALGIGIVSAFYNADQQDQLIEARLQASARALALAIGAEVQTSIQSLNVLAVSAALDPDADTQVRDTALRRTSAARGIPIALLDATGDELFHPDRRPGPVPPLPLLKDPARQVAATGKPRLLGARPSGLTGHMTAAAMVPVVRQGRVTGILITRLELEHLRQVLMAQNLADGTNAILLDEDGFVISQSDALHTERVGKPVLSDNHGRYAEASSGVFRDVSPGDGPRLVGFQRVPDTNGWAVLVSLPAGQRDDIQHELFLIYLFAGAVALAIGAGGVAYISRRVLSPLAQLERHARALAARNGEPSEIGAHALPTAMVAELETLRQGFAAAEDALVRRAQGELAVKNELIGSEKRLSDLLATLDLAPQMARDPDGTIHYWSGGCERLYGYTAADAVGRIAHELLQTRCSVPRAEIEAALRQDGFWTGDLLHRTRSGQEIVVTAYKALRRAADGRETIIEALTDRTDERRVEATLSAILDALSVGVIIADARGRVTRDNAANRVLWGVPPKSASWEEYGEWIGFWPDTGERVKADEWAMARAILQGETVQGELVEGVQFGTGEHRFFLNNAAPVRDAAGVIIGGVVVELDVTEARRAEARLAESEAQMRTLIETVPVGLILAELPSGRIISGNRFVETVLRRKVLTAPDIFHMEEWIAYHEDGTQVRPEEYPLARIALAGEESPSIEVQYERGDGTLVWTRMMGRPVHDAGGRLIGGVVAIVDIDIERRARDALTRTTAELEQVVEERTRELGESEGRLAQAAKMEALGRLAGGVAHDFNNVLQVVRGSADVIARRFRKDPDQAATLLSMISDAANRGMDVTGRLLTFARRSELSADRIAPKPMLDGLAAMLRVTLGPTVTLGVEADDAPDLLADRGQLETVIVNLVNNARDALPQEGGVVTLTARLSEQPPPQLAQRRYVRVSVADTGTGMQPEVLSRVSEPFFTTKPRGQGTGLGLAMARGFAEQSGGGLTIESSVGSGTTISLWLPVAGDDSRLETTPRVANAPASGTRGTILLVDDDPPVRMVLATMLSDKGHTVLEAGNAAAALRRLDAGDPVDLLVTDLSMPGTMDGTSLVQAARLRRPDLPAVLITGHLGSTDVTSLTASAGSGPFSVLRKPVSEHALQTVVDACLTGRAVPE